MQLEANSQSATPLPGIAQAKSAPMAEVWDLNAVENVPGVEHNAAQLTEFSELNSSGKRGFWGYLRLFFLSLLFAFAAYTAYLVWVEGRDPIEEYLHLWDRIVSYSFSEDLALPITAASDSPDRGKQLSLSAGNKKAASNLIEGNPYWHLPNSIDGGAAPLGHLWTPDEEERLRASMAHRFSYQRWRTVQDVRQKRLRGSEVILWTGIQDKKFWTRAYAAIGLAEMNIPITLTSLDGVLQDARSELISGFFERFTKRCNPGQCYVLRAALRLMDGPGRLVALRGIANSRDRYRQLYLAAATLDPEPGVQKWVKNYLSQFPLDPDRYNQLIAAIKNDTIDAQLLSDSTPSKAPSSKTKAAPQKKTDNVQDERALDQELNEQIDQLDNEVEIFEPETAMLHRGNIAVFSLG